MIESLSSLFSTLSPTTINSWEQTTVNHFSSSVVSPFMEALGQKLLRATEVPATASIFVLVLVCVKGPKGKLSGPAPALPRLPLDPGDSLFFTLSGAM